MAVKVNPPPQLRIPAKFFDDPELRAFFERQQEIIWKLWLRTGGSDDAIASTEEEATSSSSRVARNSARINSLEKIGFDIEIITADFTTERNQIIICNNTSPITVTLDTNAVEEDQVHIKRRGAAVTVVGTIDGLTNKLINIKNYSMHLVFDDIDWSEI